MKYQETIKDFEKNYDERKTKTLKAMQKYYLKTDLLKNNNVIYEVFIKKLSPINLALTVINPGSVDKEYYMTSGHIHLKKTPEFYILLDGKGILLVQKDKLKIVNLKKGEIAFIPEGYAHRLINNGKQKLKVLTIYHEDSRPNYNIKFNKRFFKK